MLKKAKRGFTVWVLVALTVVYAIVFYYLAIQTKACNPQEAMISSGWFHGFWDKYLACRQINELGDTLGGAFAPIAFLWLTGTVFIQSQELAAQRQELDETQSVMREQLEVAQQQVEETRASTALFKKQTEILEREQRARDQADADAQFDELVRNFLAFVHSQRGFEFNASEWSERLTPGLSLNGDMSQLFRSMKTFRIIDNSKYDDLAALAPDICRSADFVTKTLASERLEIDLDTWNQRLFDEIRNQVEELQAATGRLSTKHQTLAVRYMFKPMLTKLHALETAAQKSMSSKTKG